MHKNLKITILVFIGLLMPLFAITQELSSGDSLQIVPQALELSQIPDFGKKVLENPYFSRLLKQFPRVLLQKPSSK